MMIPKIHLKENTYKVYKTGIPFYDAARLIGVAHLFFGTASAEIEDKGAYWEVKGIDVRRDEEQITWILEKFVPPPRKTKSGSTQKELEYKVYEFLKNVNIDKIQQYFGQLYPQTSSFNEQDLRSFKLHGKNRALKAEYDAAFQAGTRGWDPLSRYEFLTTRTQGKDKILVKPNIEELLAATLGRGFAASVISRTKRQREEMYILPIFSSHVVLSGFLDYERFYQHSAGGFVASVLAAISILLDLTSKKIPVTDFAHTKEVKEVGPRGKPISSESGYLGFERLCSLWWKAVEENDEERLKILTQIKLFLENTARQDTDTQNQELARQLANFAVNLDVDSLCMIERLKARILASQQNIYPTLNLFKSPKDIKEVKEMVGLGLPDVPQEVSQALAKALELDEKGWMNQFTRLENATNFSQFIGYVEHIISRGYYRELQKEGQPNIRNAMNRARELTSTLKELGESLADEKKFRAWKSIFLMDVLSRMKFGGGE